MKRRGMALIETFLGKEVPPAIISIEVGIVFLLTFVALPFGLGKLGIESVFIPMMLFVFWLRFYFHVFGRQ
jgi:hypothetical protein